MNINQWTRALIAAGVVSVGAVAQAEEKPASQVLTAVSSTTLSGYVSTSAQWSPGNQAGFGHTFQGGKTDGFNLDVVDLTISKPLDEGEWAAGYGVELWLGPDAATLATDSAAGGFSGADLSVKQAYVSLNAPVGNGIVFKMGVFDTVIGYESANASQNPNYTRSYGWGIEPTQHTGLLASYQACEWASVFGGIANSHGPAVNARPAAGTAQSVKTYIAGVTLTAPEGTGFLKGATLTAGIVDGRLPATGVAGPDTSNIYVGGTIPTPLQNLSLGWSWDHIKVENAADADAIALYLGYRATDKLTVNTRVDYLDNGGAALAGMAASTGVGASATAASAELLGTTLTLDYALWKNVITRAEWRWDHDLSSGQHLPGAAGGATANNSQIFALNVIYKF